MLKAWKVVSIVLGGGILWFVPAVAGPTLSPDSVKATEEARLINQIDLLIETGGYAVQKGGRIVYARNLDRSFVPASIVKIATALASLHILGPDYRFETRFYVNKTNDLYIRGSGDPFLVSEEAAHIMDHLKKKGLDEIRDIVLDDTAYHLSVMADGSGASDNPYDAGNSALAVNFNTVNITKDGRGIVRSAEPQTPFLPLMAELGRDLPTGTFRLNISAGAYGLDKGSIFYTGELFRALQKEKKIGGQGDIRHGPVPDGLVSYYVHHSRVTVQEAIERLMVYSNNFIANQLFLACGAKRSKYPATWEKGRAALQDFLYKELGLSRQDVMMMEGSGLSRSNRVTLKAILSILNAFKPYAFLLQYINGEESKVLAKSGTLTGVYSYAGYFLHERKPDSFVLILNQKRNHRDRILDLLEQLYKNS